MARGLNTVYLAGTVTEKPELAYTQGGLAILKVNIAGSDHVMGDDGQARELAWYHRVTVFGAQAEAAVNQLEAATPVLVEGRLQQNRWQTPDGQNRSIIDIVASRISPMTLGGRDENDATLIDARGQHRLRDALNQVVIVGNLTRDAEYRETPNGIPLVRFSVAVNERIRRGNSGEFEERVHYFDATAWRDLAIGAQTLQKGDPVFISGRLVRESWVDKEGNNRSTTRIEVQRVEHLTRGPGTGGAGTQPTGGFPQAGQASTSTLDIDDEFPPEEDLPF